MTNPQRDLAHVRTRIRRPETRDELPTVSLPSRRPDVVSLQRLMGNQGMQSMIAQRRLVGTQIPGGNRSHSLAIQRSRDLSNCGKDEDQTQLRHGSPTHTNESFVQRQNGLDEEPPRGAAGQGEKPDLEKIADEVYESVLKQMEVGRERTQDPYEEPTVENGADPNSSGNSSGATVSDDGSYIEFPPQHVDTGDGASSTPETSDNGSYIEFPPQVIDEW